MKLNMDAGIQTGSNTQKIYNNKMKKLILLLIIATAFASGIKAQSDTINYIAIYRDTTKDLNGQVIYPVIMTQKIAGFKTQGTLGTFLNEKVDSTNLFAVYDVRTKKPLKASFSVEDKVVERVVAERQRNRKWRVQ